MVFAGNSSTPPATLHGKWGWFVALGVLLVIAGFIALMSVVLATIVSVLIVGWMMIFSGIVEIIHGFQMKLWSRFFMWVIIGALYVVGGFLVVWNPIFAAYVLTPFVGGFLIAAGVVRIVLAMQMRTSAQWGLVVLSGIITLLLGAIIIIGWPVSSLYTLGIFLGVDLIFAG